MGRNGDFVNKRMVETLVRGCDDINQRVHSKRRARKRREDFESGRH